MSTPDPRRTPQGPRHTLCLRAALTPTSRRGSCALRPLPGASCAAVPPTRAPTRRGSPGCASAAGGPVLGLEVRHRREQRVLSGLVDGPRQDACRESRPPRKSPAQSGALAGPQDRVPAPAQRLAACWGRAEPFGHRVGRGCDGAAARAARGSAVSGRESRLPCHPPVAAPFTQDPAVTPAQARAVCRRENPSWTSVQLERCGPCVRAHTRGRVCTRLYVCLRACVYVCTCVHVPHSASRPLAAPRSPRASRPVPMGPGRRQARGVDGPGGSCRAASVGLTGLRRLRRGGGRPRPVHTGDQGVGGAQPAHRQADRPVPGGGPVSRGRGAPHVG